ncbi:MarR family winged helix-turn-helix transcriptional regulator [Jeotgalibaca sp. A122]|uniref:MarR family winged helix-turn-helix transcriptional regulator n=1 Tax=Jeotgalibaca sp. A122 TaxID=3457322 RepID=UPI003FCFCC31
MEKNPNTPVTEILTHINRLKLQRQSQQKTGRGTGIVLSYLYDNDTNVIPSELGKMMNVSTPRITTILNKLEAKNLIERNISPEDRRNVFITLSDEGRKIAAEKKAQQEKLIQTLVSRVDEQDIQAFIRVLDALEIVIDEQGWEL